jgi:8-oxo-dGTP diphosphatase
VIHAAGGLVWRQARDAPELLTIRRVRYGDEWTLPKGKLDPGETWEAAALREVREETGCTARLGAFAGGMVYMVKGRPKVVLYWHMDWLSSEGGPDGHEVVELAWLAPNDALARLTHPSERELVTEALADPGLHRRRRRES